MITLIFYIIKLSAILKNWATQWKFVTTPDRNSVPHGRKRQMAPFIPNTLFDARLIPTNEFIHAKPVALALAHKGSWFNPW